MKALKRIENVIVALLMLVMAAGVLLSPDDGPSFALGILSIMLLFMGIRYLFFYFSMARYMVGGKSILYRGAIIFDIGFFAAGLDSVPNFYIMLYLIGVLGFAGAVSVLNALEARKVMSHHWKLRLMEGITEIIFAVICLFNLSSARMVSYTFSLAMIYSAIMRLIKAFRKTAIIHIS